MLSVMSLTNKILLSGQVFGQWAHYTLSIHTWGWLQTMPFMQEGWLLVLLDGYQDLVLGRIVCLSQMDQRTDANSEWW